MGLFVVPNAPTAVSNLRAAKTNIEMYLELIQEGDTNDNTYLLETFALGCLKSAIDQLNEKQDSGDMKIKQIEWTEVREPNKECSYTHTIGTTPIGRFLLTWKGWKAYFDPALDETPWTDDQYVYPEGNNVEECQQWVQEEFNRRILDLIDKS